MGTDVNYLKFSSSSSLEQRRYLLSAKRTGRECTCRLWNEQLVTATPLIHTMNNTIDQPFRHNAAIKQLEKRSAYTSAYWLSDPGGIFVNFLTGNGKSSVKAYMQMSRRLAPRRRQRAAVSARHAISISPGSRAQSVAAHRPTTDRSPPSRRSSTAPPPHNTHAPVGSHTPYPSVTATAPRPHRRQRV